MDAVDRKPSSTEVDHLATALADLRTHASKLERDLESRSQAHAQARVAAARQRQEIADRDAIIASMRAEGISAQRRVKRRLVVCSAFCVLGWVVSSALLWHTALLETGPIVAAMRWATTSCSAKPAPLVCSLANVTDDGCVEVFGLPLGGWSCVPRYLLSGPATGNRQRGGSVAGRRDAALLSSVDRARLEALAAVEKLAYSLRDSVGVGSCAAWNEVGDMAIQNPLSPASDDQGCKATEGCASSPCALGGGCSQARPDGVGDDLLPEL